MNLMPCNCVIAESSLRELDVSFNKLGSLGVELLLRSVRCDVITSLNLRSTIATPTANTIARHLHAYLTKVRCDVMISVRKFRKHLRRVRIYCTSFLCVLSGELCAAEAVPGFLLSAARACLRPVRVSEQS